MVKKKIWKKCLQGFAMMWSYLIIAIWNKNMTQRRTLYAVYYRSAPQYAEACYDNTLQETPFDIHHTPVLWYIRVPFFETHDH